MDELAELVKAIGDHRRPHIIDAARTLATTIRAEADTLSTNPITTSNRRRAPVLASLPPQTFTQSRLWRYQLATAADALAADTETLGAPIPRSTGEEMTLHLILRNAATNAGCPPNQVHNWPDDDPPRPDAGWGDLYEYLFEDHDVLMLYDAARHNLAHLGGVNMHPHQWFSEFTPATPVPDRPTDRN